MLGLWARHVLVCGGGYLLLDVLKVPRLVLLSRGQRVALSANATRVAPGPMEARAQSARQGSSRRFRGQVPV